MSVDDDIPQLERVTFFAGQQLGANDLTALNSTTRELQWLHNRSLHSWGIGIGFDVTGKRGDSAVTIAPGYGIDCLGHEIILCDARIKTVPAVAHGADNGDGIYYLVVAYQSDADQAVAERRPGVCVPGGTVRLDEEPLIDWRTSNDLREGRELVLAQAAIRNCQLNAPLLLAARRYARPLQQPYIGAGQTVSEKTQWKTWFAPGGTRLGVETAVDTSSGQFGTTPIYMAHIVGDRFVAQPPGPGFLLGFPAVVDATPTGFTLQVLLPDFGDDAQSVNTALPADPNAILHQLKWRVVWMGTEA